MPTSSGLVALFSSWLPMANKRRSQGFHPGTQQGRAVLQTTAAIRCVSVLAACVSLSVLSLTLLLPMFLSFSFRLHASFTALDSCLLADCRVHIMMLLVIALVKIKHSSKYELSGLSCLEQSGRFSTCSAKHLHSTSAWRPT